MSRPTPEYGNAPDLRVLDGVASWCGGLHGSMPLANALKALADGLDARSAAISRHFHRTEERPRLVSVSSGAQSEPLTRAFCRDVLGYQFGRARAGTVWFLGDVIDDPAWTSTVALNALVANGQAQEIAVIPMSVTRQSVDYIEFHFSHALPRSAQHDIEALVPTIERSWRGRKPGLVTQVIADERLPVAKRAADKAAWDDPILGVSNPAGLSRAEFRVCLMLSRGLSVKGVSEELGLSENTVRSHLRAIYAKTETSNMSELIYCILSSGVAEDTATHTRRRA